MSKPKLFHVTYYYLATGMEGIADHKDYGVGHASSKEDAIERVVNKEYPNGPEGHKIFLRSCLSAKEVDRS